MLGRTSRLPQPCQGTAWLHPPLETSSKAMATSPGGVTASPGDFTVQQPQLGFPGDATLQGVLQHGGGWWHGAHPGSGPGRVSGRRCPLHVATGGLVELLLAKPPHPVQEGLQGRGALAWAAFCPDRPGPCLAMGGTTPHSLLPLSAFQDRTTGSPAHPPTSAPSIMSEVMGPCCALSHGGWGGSGGCSAPGRTRPSQCQTGAASHSWVPPPASAPVGPAVWLAVGLHTLWVLGGLGDVRVLRPWGLGDVRVLRPWD